ncbi:MAG: DHH family phosphoesterase [Flavobacteriales bacterium]
MVQELRATLEQSEQWLITTHKGPDGDAVGSVVAWAALAEQLKKPYHIIFPDQPADYLLPFLADYHWSVYATENSYTADVLFCLDYNAPGRVGEVMSDFIVSFSATKVMLDHHPGPDAFCDFVVSKPQLCSTTQVIYECLEELGWESYVNLAMAQGIYLGLMTDTGSFRFPSVNAKTHQIVAHLFSLGLKQYQIHEAVYDVNTVSRLQLRGYAIAEKLQMFDKQGIGLITLSKTELERFNYQKGDTEGLVNVILSIAGMQVAIFMMETTEGVKFSFRSKGERYVNAFAQQYFGGGGHQYAAGGFWPSDLQTALDRLLQHLKEL